MNTKQRFLALILSLFTSFVPGYTRAIEDVPMRQGFKQSHSTALTHQSKPIDPLELESFVDAYIAEQMNNLEVLMILLTT